jgi:hypothetical protein
MKHAAGMLLHDTTYTHLKSEGWRQRGAGRINSSELVTVADTPSGGYLHRLHLHTFKQAIELCPSFSPPVHGEHATIPNYLDCEA